MKFSELEKIPSSQAKDYQVGNFLAAEQTLVYITLVTSVLSVTSE